MTKYISNAQNFEDIYLYRACSLIKEGFGDVNVAELIVDIGAWEPLADTVSVFYVEIECRAILASRTTTH